MKKKLIPFLFALQFLFAMPANASDSLSYRSEMKIELLQKQIDNLQKQIDDSNQHRKELYEANKGEIEKLMEQKEDAIDSRMLIYVSIFVAAFILVFGFFRWLGKSEIRKIVHDQAVKQIESQLQIKLSNEIIDAKLTSLGKPLIEQMLLEISESRQKAKASADELEESSKAYKKLLEELGNKGDKKASNDESKVSSSEKETKLSQDDWFKKGEEAYSKDKLNEAIEYLSESIKLNSDVKNSDAFYSVYYRALTHFKLNQFQEALDDIREAIKLDEKDYAYLVEGLIYEKLNRNSDGIESLNKALEINPNYDVATEVKERLTKKSSL